MKKFLKITVVMAGLAIALAGSISKALAHNEQLQAPAEGCKNSGDCGTTPGGVKLNGKWEL